MIMKMNKLMKNMAIFTKFSYKFNKMLCNPFIITQIYLSTQSTARFNASLQLVALLVEYSGIPRLTRRKYISGTIKRK